MIFLDSDQPRTLKSHLIFISGEEHRLMMIIIIFFYNYNYNRALVSSRQYIIFFEVSAMIKNYLEVNENRIPRVARSMAANYIYNINYYTINMMMKISISNRSSYCIHSHDRAFVLSHGYVGDAPTKKPRISLLFANICWKSSCHTLRRWL
jgi:hypothetical protein